jgi:adenylate cyclase
MGAKLQIQPSQADPFDVAIGNTATIGRTRENTVCLGFSPLVSRQHAIIRCHNGWQFQLIDLGSRNGTYVNDQRVVMPVTLTDGARIRIADNTIIFSEHNDDSGSEHNAMTLVGTIDHSVVDARPVGLLVCGAVLRSIRRLRRTERWEALRNLAFEAAVRRAETKLAADEPG